MVEDEKLFAAIKLLPTEAAKLLADQNGYVQRMVVSQMANILTSWEAKGLVLDPITFDGVVQTVVGTLLANALIIERLDEENCVGPVPEA